VLFLAHRRISEDVLVAERTARAVKDEMKATPAPLTAEMN
jgi:hypothetical protein